MFDGISLGSDLSEYQQDNGLDQNGDNVGQSRIFSVEKIMEYERSCDAHESHVHQRVAEKDSDEKPARLIEKFNDVAAGFLFIFLYSLRLDFGKSGQCGLRARKKGREHHQQTQADQMNEYAQYTHSDANDTIIEGCSPKDCTLEVSLFPRCIWFSDMVSLS